MREFENTFQGCRKKSSVFWFICESPLSLHKHVPFQMEGNKNVTSPSPLLPHRNAPHFTVAPRSSHRVLAVPAFVNNRFQDEAQKSEISSLISEGRPERSLRTAAIAVAPGGGIHCTKTVTYPTSFMALLLFFMCFSNNNYKTKQKIKH